MRLRVRGRGGNGGVQVVVGRLFKESPKCRERRSVARLVKVVEVLDFLVNGRTFTIVERGVCLRLLQWERSTVGFAGEVENVTGGVRSSDEVSGMVPKPRP